MHVVSNVGAIYTIHLLLNFSVGIFITNQYNKRLIMGKLIVIP